MVETVVTVGRIHRVTADPSTKKKSVRDSRLIIYFLKLLFKRETVMLRMHAMATCMGLHADEERLFIGSDDGSILCWNVGLRRFSSLLHGHSGPVWGLDVRWDAVVSGSFDKMVKVWSIGDSNKCVATLRAHTGWISDVLWCGGDAIASCSWDGTVRTWFVVL